MRWIRLSWKQNNLIVTCCEAPRFNFTALCEQASAEPLSENCSIGRIHVFFPLSHSFLSSSSSSFLGFRDVWLSFSAAGAPWFCDCSGRWRHGLWLRYFCPALRRPPCVCGLQEGIHQHTSSSWGGEDSEIEGKWDNIRKKNKYMLVASFGDTFGLIFCYQCQRSNFLMPWTSKYDLPS